jgi:hypothetical protein
MRTIVSARWNPKPFYFRPKVMVSLTALATVFPAVWASGVGKEFSWQNASGAGKASSRSERNGGSHVLSIEGLTLKTIDPHTPHSFLPFVLEARPGRSAHSRKSNPLLSFVPSRLRHFFTDAAPGPDMPLALAITQAVRPFPYPVLRREFLDQALNAFDPEVRQRASACLAVTGTPDN